MKNKKTKDSSRFTLHIPKAMRDELEAIAHREARSIANVIRLAVEKFIVEYKTKQKFD